MTTQNLLNMHNIDSFDYLAQKLVLKYSAKRFGTEWIKFQAAVNENGV